jgi:MerR family transcriptional regulator, light-induced transcriptional regulator
MNTLPEVPSPMASNDPLYNIGVVTRMTGISMATLRAWERRYNFPESSRTAGGHRLYSERDVFRLRWVKERIDDGMQTAQAINALRHQEERGHLHHETLSSAEVLHREEGKPILPHYKDLLVETLTDRQLDRADQVLGEALASTTPEDLILHIIGPAMSSIGDAWEHRRISVVTEHLATNYLRQRLLMWMLSGPPPYAKPPIVLACAPDEWHEGSLLILGALLRRRRWPIAYLGQNVPLADLASYIQEIRPTLVVMVAMMEESAGKLVEWPQWMPDVVHTGKPIICYGGRVFSEHPEWRVRMPGRYLGSSIDEGIITIESIMK